MRKVQIFPLKILLKGDWKNNILNAIFLAILKKKKKFIPSVFSLIMPLFVFAPYVEFGFGCVVFGTWNIGLEADKQMKFGKRNIVNLNSPKSTFWISKGPTEWQTYSNKLSKSNYILLFELILEQCAWCGLLANPEIYLTFGSSPVVNQCLYGP